MSLCAGCSAVDVHRYSMCLKCRLLEKEINDSFKKKKEEKLQIKANRYCSRCKKNPVFGWRKSCKTCLMYFASKHVYKTDRGKWRKQEVAILDRKRVVERFLSSSYR